MDKGIRVEQIFEATRLLKKHSIKPAFFLQLGYPTETIEDIKLTINMVNKLLPYDIGISVSYPLPGTRFYESVKLELKTKTNWTDSDELALMFHNTYKPEFYKQLHRLIHKSYRKHQSLDMLSKLFKCNYKETNLKRIIAYPYYYIGAIKEKRKLKLIESDAAAGL
jgi:anaerobic magnesium-protoporphyrin IX monomethyl ester cyclase